MARIALKAIGWRSVRLRLSMSDKVWNYLDGLARTNGVPLRDAPADNTGNYVAHSFDFDANDLIELASVDPDTPVIGPDGLVYEASELPGFARPLERKA